MISLIAPEGICNDGYKWDEMCSGQSKEVDPTNLQVHIIVFKILPLTTLRCWKRKELRLLTVVEGFPTTVECHYNV